MGVPVADLVQSGEKLLTDATRNTTPQDILTLGQVTLSAIEAIALALLDEFLGMVILATACIARIVNQFLKPMATLSWMLLFASLMPSAVKHL
ncbi:MAG: hypothetical protein A4E53_04547 [Pelotomaculum sp. PtaB.Bin104]|nr:MAG: hypothetical protein A4E53_04547 [Pelotomaculum sp. PtaB.Bin104]